MDAYILTRKDDGYIVNFQVTKDQLYAYKGTITENNKRGCISTTYLHQFGVSQNTIIRSMKVDKLHKSL